MLRESGRLSEKGLAAASRHATRPDTGRRDAKRQKAKESFDSRSAKALARALDRGVGYAGTDPASLGNQCESLFGGAGLAHDFQVVLRIEHGSEAGANHGVVVEEKHSSRNRFNLCHP